MSPLALTSHAGAGVASLALTGELDMSSSAVVADAIAGLESGSPALLVLDLRQLSFMDSTGLRIVVAANARAEQAGRRFVVVRAREAVHRIFRITRMDERVEMVDEPPPLDQAPRDVQ